LKVNKNAHAYAKVLLLAKRRWNFIWAFYLAAIQGMLGTRQLQTETIRNACSKKTAKTTKQILCGLHGLCGSRILPV
jgi:hypothetical protein